jgi:hypothetical protein
MRPAAQVIGVFAVPAALANAARGGISVPLSATRRTEIPGVE